MSKNRERIITFKTDEEMADRLDRIANKSEFIRRAILTALGQDCPLCQGTGSLNSEQRRHWQHFLTTHTLTHCEQCNAVHFICNDVQHKELQ